MRARVLVRCPLRACFLARQSLLVNTHEMPSCRLLQHPALAGEFNALSVVTEEQWDMLEAMIRKTNKKGS